MIATEAAAEVSTCSSALIIATTCRGTRSGSEQRDGPLPPLRPTLYDVVVISFLNTRNQADQRVLELLTGEVPAVLRVCSVRSDEVLGRNDQQRLDF